MTKSAIAANHQAMTGNSLGDKLFPNGDPNLKNFRATKLGFKLVTEQGPAQSSSVQCRTEQQTIWDTEYVETETQECETIQQKKCSTLYRNQCKPVKRQQCNTVYENECTTQYQQQCSTQYKYETQNNDIALQYFPSREE